MFDVGALLESKGLYQTRLPTGQSFTWRLLTLVEYGKLVWLRESGAMNELAFYNAVFEHCYVGDARLLNQDLPVGIFFGIGQLIMWLSGDSAQETQAQDIDLVRDSYPAQSVNEHLKHVIMIAFGYKPEELEDLTRPELLKKFAIAEAVLLKRGTGYEPLDTSKIMTAEQAQASNKIDYARDNAELNKAMVGQEHILDQDPSQLANAIQKRNRLDAASARRLDRMQRASRGG